MRTSRWTARVGRAASPLVAALLLSGCGRIGVKLLPLQDTGTYLPDGGAAPGSDAGVVDGAVPGSNDGSVRDAGMFRDAAYGDASTGDAGPIADAASSDGSVRGDAGSDAGLDATLPNVCGDGFLLVGVEACDDGNRVDTDGCLNTCVVASCGDGVARAGVEACDDGNGVETDTCLNTCVAASCGDSVVRLGVETCDDGNAVDTDACSNTCTVASCGDGVVRAGVEACDDGNDVNTDACLNTCVAASCGDSFVRAGVESCDDGNAVNTDACLNTCAAASCGDSFVRAGVEVCDDGNVVDGDSCSSTCTGIAELAWGGQSEGYCFKSAAGLVKCWGDNAAGRCGLGNTVDRGDGPNEMGANLPAVNLGTGRTARAVQTGYFSCALLDNGTVKCWGRNDRGQLGQGHTNSLGDNANEMGDNLAAIALGTGRTAVQLAKGQLHTCVRLDNGTVKCWGDGSISQLGDGQKIRRGDGAGEMGDNLPVVNLGTGRTAVQLVAGEHHTCAILDNNRLKCWGSNNDGNLGLGDVAQHGGEPGEMGDNLPYVNLGTGRTVAAVFAGISNTCARLDNGAFRCWGLNSDGQLLLGTTNTIGDAPGEMGDALVAPRFGTGRTATSIAIGAGHICALLDNSTVKCWGNNIFGRLGLGDTTTRGTSGATSGDNLPAVSLGTGLTPVQVAVGWPNSCALFDDARVKCWGGNATGQLGLGDTTHRGDNGGEMGNSLPFVSVP